MSRRYVVDCDTCGAKALKEPIHLNLIVGRHMDGAGSMENVDEEMDICPSCAERVLHEIINESYTKAVLFYKQNKRIV